MNRAFVSLYLIIVLSVIVLGLVFNKFWEEFNPADDIGTNLADIFQLAEISLENSDSEQARTKRLQAINAKLKAHLELLELQDFAKTDILESLKGGKIINASNESGGLFYKRLANTNLILALNVPPGTARHQYLYVVFIVVFYAAIAFAIFLWVWPLSRDLSRLVKHTQEIGKANLPANIKISSRSVLHPFAKAFNSMAKRLNELLRSQKEMTYAVSHELRTPLARIKFALAMLETQPRPPQLQKQLDSIHSDTLEMEALTNALLSYASFEQTSQQLGQRPGYMRGLVEEIVLRLAEPEHPKIKISIQDQTADGIFSCEWSLMQTALQNLLVNALGFACSEILIRLQATTEAFCIVVEDDGPGIPEQERERVFESFVRLYSEQGNRSGFGLGLAIVKRIISWHQGEVQCVNSSLGGAGFVLRWPNLSY